ncbi:hypothetical protein L0U88_00840 [Flavihumibacter sp. RY-1]|uniref:Uncharacterized protein n=1 Tax=Flavihumibacter fluminis TaxID=2909236 RepID=A0ABS9BC42_9BACT|nr:hypothetical protein [Flavihumibacter fluminis]MCF1713172.1 hypothetical protein [Flavihumibacter fluminis]
MQLNQESYNQLLNYTNSKQKRPTKEDNTVPDWYALTYSIFLDSPLNNLQDFWRLVAYTYSWMPTIPTINSHLISDEKQLLTDLKSLKKGEDQHLEALFTLLIPVINNSLVGVSKTLHFIAPDTVPIIDSNVTRGWNEFFSTYPTDNIKKFPTYSNALTIKQLSNYLKYRETLLSWVVNSNASFSLRDLEWAFFELGIALNPKHGLIS